MRKTLRTGLLLASAAIPLAGLNASAASMIDSTTYGGHTYELWADTGVSWENALSAAVGGGGYLATLTDPAETSAVYGDFIGTGFFTSNAGQAHQAWLGGYTTDSGFTTIDPNAWAWINGDAWTAIDAGNFAAGEPNGDSTGLTINRFGTSKWNDEGGTVGGYIVEKDGTRVPDSGSTLALLASACAAMGALGRRILK